MTTALSSTPAGPQVGTVQGDGEALLTVGAETFRFPGRWIEGTPWERFGLYDAYVVVRGDGAVETVPAHAGELVPGSTEDLVTVLRRYDPEARHPPAPMTLELDPTYRCASRDCGGRCFSAPYRRLAPAASLPTPLLAGLVRDFAGEGGRVVRFDGGGDPLAHPAVRDGALPELAAGLGLKTTILTAGDLLDRADLERIGRAGCYLRVSLNAGTDETRMRFHGNRIRLRDILASIESFAAFLTREGLELPIGATFLLDTTNHHEVVTAARRARDAGVSHFSVRRVLGPPALRPRFSADDEAEIGRLLGRVRRLGTAGFRVFVPWRPPGEDDLDPSGGELPARRCWQSTFKTVVEPEPATGVFRVQLCGRYRGGGVGQRMQLPALLSSGAAEGWTAGWRRSFTDFRISRELLPRTCRSCIDRGFIRMVERLIGFVGDPRAEFTVLHLATGRPAQGSAAGES